MNKRIYKYTLTVLSRQGLQLPLSAEILTVQVQSDYLQLWAMVDVDEKQVKMHEITIYGTGQPLPDSPGKYIVTVQHSGLVWHVFESTRT